MKTTVKIFFLVCLLIAQVVQAQEPRPKWAKESLPYNYYVGMGIGATEPEAIAIARADAFAQSLQLDIVATKTTYATIMDSVKIKIPSDVSARKNVCQTPAIHNCNGDEKVYVLLYLGDNYNTNDIPCYDTEFEQKLEQWNKKLIGEYGFSPRVFFPGVAQIHKGSTAKGILFIVGEASLIVSAVVMDNKRADENSLYNTTHDKQIHSDNARKYSNIRDGLIGGAIALYAWNVIDGWVAKGKKCNMLGNNHLKILPYYADRNSGGLTLALNF